MTKNVHSRSVVILFTFLASASLAVAQPVITKLSKINTQQFQTITIVGSGFGTEAPYTGDSNYISLTDESANPGWEAGYAPYNDTVTLIVQKWTDTKIVLGGFSGQWGQYDYILTVGDAEQIEIWNPQTGSGPAQVTTTIVGAETTTTLKSAPNPSAVGQAVRFTADVSTTDGAPPDGETVTFMKGKTAIGKGELSGGVATFVTKSLPAGTSAIVASYHGDTQLAASKSAPVNQVVQ